jgi:BolA protein
LKICSFKAFKPDLLEVIDESHKHAGHVGASQGGHFQIIIVAKAFEGKKLLDSHRLIYKALEPVKSSIYALAIKVSATLNTGH